MEGTFLKPDIGYQSKKTAEPFVLATHTKAFKPMGQGYLPMANIGENVASLYHAIIELNQLFLPPQQRLQLLDVIREKIHFVCTELSPPLHRYAGSMPEKQRKIANLARPCNLHLCPEVTNFW